MATKIEQINYGNFYHIYNCGNNGEDIFRENENYKYFLDLYNQNISPIADTFSWCLMKNHFHFLVRIKDKKVIENTKTASPSIQFSKLFNSYSQAFNKRYNRQGSLFKKSFRRKKVMNNKYLRNLVLYIHNNPVHHNFVNHAGKYPWSSYLSCISLKPTKINRSEVIGWFDDKAEFITTHNEKIDILKIEKWLNI